MTDKEIIKKFSDNHCLVLENNQISLREDEITAYQIALGKSTNELLEFVKDTYLQLKRKEQELEPFKDDYFKNLDTKTIAELAKKSIRITTEYRKLENILRDIKEICLQQNLKADFTACEILEKIK